MPRPIVLEYTAHGSPVSDWALESELQMLGQALRVPLQSRFRYSTENIFHAVRCAVAEGRLPAGQVIFRYRGQDYPVTRYGTIENWPDDFCDRQVVFAERTLVAAARARLAERRQGDGQDQAG